MSLWSPDTLIVLLGHSRVAVTRRGQERSGWQSRVTTDNDSVSPLQRIVHALRAGLAESKARHASHFRVLLEADWLRYRVVPWREEFDSPAARRAYVEHCFAEAFGVTAKRWAILESPGRYGRATLAAAVDNELLTSLASVVAEHQLRLRSVMPALVPAFNALVAKPLPDLFWFVLLESAHMTLLLSLSGEPLVLRVAVRDTEHLPKLLDREWNALGLVFARCPVYCIDTATQTPVPRALGHWHIEAAPPAACLHGLPEMPHGVTLKAA